MHPNTDPRYLRVNGRGRKRGRSSRSPQPGIPGNNPICPRRSVGAASTSPPDLPAFFPRGAPDPGPTAAGWTASLPGPGCAEHLGPTCFSGVVTSTRRAGRAAASWGRPATGARPRREEGLPSCLRRSEFYLLHLRAGGAGGPRSAEAGGRGSPQGRSRRCRRRSPARARHGRRRLAGRPVARPG